jgi:hypothetical protein
MSAFAGARTHELGPSCALALIASLALACSSDDVRVGSATQTQPSARTAGNGGTDRPPQTDPSLEVDPLMITLADGQLKGERAGAARVFKKIPFAKPPVGELRWKAPVANEPWTGVRAETDFVAGCAQLADQGAPASNNEDCLYLNVWSPEPAPENAAVMVWIHGGGNFSGGAGIPIPTTQTTRRGRGHDSISSRAVGLLRAPRSLG